MDLGDRGKVIPNGVDLSEFRDAMPTRRPRPYVLAMGRHVRQKGFDVLIDAWAEVQSRLPHPIDLVIAGDGPERGALLALARERNVDDTIEFPGRCDRTGTASLFAGCVAFVLSSCHEPFGIVNLEAMAAGKPVVATNVGGVGEIVDDGVTGILVPAGDASALANALERVLTTPDLANALGDAGKARSAAYEWTRIGADYERVYGDVHPPAALAVILREAFTAPCISLYVGGYGAAVVSAP